jgi:hypothetical protein
MRLACTTAILLAMLVAGCGGANAPSAATPASAPEATEATAESSGMDEAAFWTVIEDSREAAGGNTERQSGLIQQRLEQLPAAEIADFGRIWHSMDERLYSWEVWGAAYVIDDGCSDDCFRDFRAYLILLGRARYEAALRDPDSLAPVVQDAEKGDWENADNVAPEAYEDVAGEDIPSGDSDLSGDPRGERWNGEQHEWLARRYPRLAERFR